jgi:hypothetical protein
MTGALAGLIPAWGCSSSLKQSENTAKSYRAVLKKGQEPRRESTEPTRDVGTEGGEKRETSEQWRKMNEDLADRMPSTANTMGDARRAEASVEQGHDKERSILKSQRDLAVRDSVNQKVLAMIEVGLRTDLSKFAPLVNQVAAMKPMSVEVFLKAVQQVGKKATGCEPALRRTWSWKCGRS